MDVRRILLIAGLAVVSYLMILQWSQDYSDPVAQAQNSASLSSGSDVPVAVNNASNSEVPSAEAATTDTSGPVAASAVSGTQIEVHTDVLNLRIDLNGGDIVHASLRQYPAHANTPDVPFTILENEQRTYTAMSGLVGADGVDTEGRAQFETAQARYDLVDGDDQLVVTLSYAADNGLLVDKVYTLTRGSYLINVRYDLNNRSEETRTTNFFGQIKRDRSDDPSQGGGIGMSSYLGVALTTPDDRYKKVSFGDMEDETFRVSQQGGWIAFLQHYFESAWIPPTDLTHNYYARQLNNGFYYAGFQSPAVTLAPGESASTGADFYVGPKVQERLEAISPNLNLTVDYGWLWWAAQPLFHLLEFMHSLVGNWGWAVVLMTLVVKTVLYPLTASSYRSMAKMRKFAPKMTQLREQYGDDRQQLGQEMMKLYRKEKLNPMGGCLPILIQMPVFIALYWVLKESVELRQAPFIFWIDDLSIKDPFFVLPLLMGASMFLQMQMQQQPTMDPTQARIMKLMPVMFTFMFLWFPAGLTLYWFVNNVSTIVQQWIVNRQFERAEAKKGQA
ncbi:membrane protein insertase YidC [Saccharospirillum mangrovi]|uniref:membrane protein insertase YidC n=1 Tax=Saccharospirillum mangrovi TaxID=2161747 RepID=UPI000D3D7392|nr:membrane protein insertase YidC [Saccharospirillum mangrovi]